MSQKEIPQSWDELGGEQLRIYARELHELWQREMRAQWALAQLSRHLLEVQDWGKGAGTDYPPHEGLGLVSSPGIGTTISVRLPHPSSANRANL